MSKLKMNIDVVENIYNETYEALDLKIEEIFDRFLSGESYNQLKSSNILNFNGYIENKKNNLEQVKGSTKNVKDFFKECIDNHYGVDGMLREVNIGNITDSNCLSILSSIKKLSSYDKKYDEKSNHPVIEFEPSFKILISNSDIKFNESYSIVNQNYEYKDKTVHYEEEVSLKEGTPSSVIYGYGNN